jgi:tetratricopeptide (TPR) repeat protein
MIFVKIFSDIILFVNGNSYTLKKLRDRLQNQKLPKVDVVHFSGPSRQDASLEEQARADLKSLPATLKKEASNIELTKDTTYLLFEQDKGEPLLVPTPLFANLLNRYQVPLVILSACRWARVGHKEDVDSVAAELSAKGIPFVLAIRYWMLKPATQILFKTLYQGLAQGKKIGAALHTARLALYEQTERREILSQKGLLKINLHDWFSPVLYQLGQDTALLTKIKSDGDSIEENNFISNNLPRQQRAGFFGRGPELCKIERSFMRGRRRFILSGCIAGQGKTCLAQESGRWLQRTGLFKRVVFIDYANYQGLNPVSVAVSAIANVLQKNLLDADAVTQALRRVPTLLIFDNIDVLSTSVPVETVEEKTEITDTELLIKEPSLILEDSPFNDDGLPQLILEQETETKESKNDEEAFSFEIPEIPEKSEKHENEPNQVDALSKLLEVAKKWSEAGQSGVLIITQNKNFDHPAFSDKLKIGKLSLGELDKKEALRYFEALMILSPKSKHGMPKRDEVEILLEKVRYHPLSINILAYGLKNETVEKLTNDEHSLQDSMNLFIDRLKPELREHLPKMGIFKGGAFENVLQAITEMPHKIWQELREALESVGLIQAENFEGVKVPYLKFHSALAPRLLERLSSKEQQQLKKRYSHGYHEFSEFLYDLDNPYQAHFIEQRELPNLLEAVYDAVDKRREWSTSFANKVKSFLADFGLTSDNDKFKEITHQEENEESSHCDWFVQKSALADEYYSVCKYLDAQEVYEDIIEALEDRPNFDGAVALGWVGRCMAEQGEIDEAIESFRKALSELAELETSPKIEQETVLIQSYLAAVLKEKGDIGAAITAYETALSMAKSIKDQHEEAVIETEMGILQMSQGDLVKAERLLHHALSVFQTLNQPIFEADTLYHLGQLYTQAKQWKAAAQVHKKAAKIFAEQGHASNAAENWEHLAELSENIGNSQEANMAYHNTIECYKASIDKNADSNDPRVLGTYKHMAEIAEKLKDTAQVKEYRRLAKLSTTTDSDNERSEKRSEKLDKHKQFIDAVVATIGHPGLRAQLDTMLEQREKKGWQGLIAAIRKLLNGDRDGDKLCKGLDSEDASIVHEIISRVEVVKEKEMSLL